MGFNLGSFAGGLAQGAQAGENIKLKRREMDSIEDTRKRQLAVLEAEEGRKKSAFDEEQAMKDEAKAIHAKWFGGGAPAAGQPVNLDEAAVSYPVSPGGPPAQKPAPATVTNLGGSPQPVAAAQGQPGANPDFQKTASQLGYMTDLMALQLKRKADPETLKKLVDYTNQVRGKEQTELLYAATRGDAAALQKVAEMYGGSKAEIVRDAKTGVSRIDFGNGKPPEDFVQLLQIAAGRSIADAQLDSDSRATAGDKNAREIETHGSNLRAADSKLKTDAAHITLMGKQGNLADAQADYTRDGKKGSQQARVDGAVVKLVDEALGKRIDASDGKSEWTGPRSFVFAQVAKAKGKDSKEDVAAEAIQQARTIEEKARAQVARLLKDPTTKAQLEAATGSRDPKVILQRSIDFNLDRALRGGAEPAKPAKKPEAKPASGGATGSW